MQTETVSIVSLQYMVRSSVDIAASKSRVTRWPIEKANQWTIRRR